MTPCVVWTAAKNKDGYGYLRVRTKIWKAHRYAWVLVNGPIPPEVCVCHRCDNPSCVNVEHLFLGTHQENMQDMVEKGRSPNNLGEKNPNSILTVVEVAAIRADRVSKVKEIARKYNVSANLIYKIRQNKLWRVVC